MRAVRGGTGTPPRMRAGYIAVNIFFAAVLQVAPRRFYEDADILADFVHLKENPVKMVPETTLECVRRFAVRP